MYCYVISVLIYARFGHRKRCDRVLC